MSSVWLKSKLHYTFLYPESSIKMEELITNLHMHTRYSDGEGSHDDIGQAALQAGLDAVIVTDHNILVSGMERYYERDSRRVLMLVGEEVHDRTRDPQKNHLLILGGTRELSPFAPQPQQLINQARAAEALTFIAHPVDEAMPSFGEPDISWVDWQADGFTGIELWNGFSEMKSVARSKLQAVFMALFPRHLAHHPLPATLQRWDLLTQTGKRIVAVGGSDAHNYHRSLGPIKKEIYPYSFHFRCINTHILTPTGLTGNLLADKKMILSALAQGHAFVGYDLPASTRGFRFTGAGKDGTVVMGDEVALQDGITFQIRLPEAVECRLLKDGNPIKVWKNKDICTFIANQPGVYRVESYIHYLGKRRGWIFSNPIYVR